MEKRYLSLEGESTACFAVRLYEGGGDDGKDQLILALPFRDDHVGN